METKKITKEQGSAYQPEIEGFRELLEEAMGNQALFLYELEVL